MKETDSSTATRIALATGLEAWADLNTDQTPEAIAARYDVDVDAVARNKEATAELHRQLCKLFGTEFYFEALGFEEYIGAAIARDMYPQR